MILVTGSNGLVGSHLLHNLTVRGIKVRALIRNINKIKSVLQTFSYYTKSPEKLLEYIEWVEGDITDIDSIENALEGIKKVYHTAAFVSFNPRHKRKIFETNVKGTSNLVNLCLEKKIHKLCFVSSIAALGQNEIGQPITEEILWKPSKKVSSYSLSKYHSEMEVWRGITEGLNAVIINPSVILGPGNWEKGSQSIFQVAAKGISFYTKGTNGFVDVRDVVQGMVNAMDSDITAERFTLSSENIPYRTFLSLIAQAFHNKLPDKEASKFLLLLLQKTEYLRSLIFNCEPKLTSDMASILQNISTYSNKKSKEKLNLEYRPLQNTINDICYIFNIEKHLPQ